MAKVFALQVRYDTPTAIRIQVHMHFDHSS